MRENLNSAVFMCDVRLRFVVLITMRLSLEFELQTNAVACMYVSAVANIKTAACTGQSTDRAHN